MQVHPLQGGRAPRDIPGRSGPRGLEGHGVRGVRGHGAFRRPGVRRLHRRLHPREARLQSRSDHKGAEGVREGRLDRRRRGGLAAQGLRPQAGVRGRAHRCRSGQEQDKGHQRSRRQGILQVPRLLRGPALHGQGSPIIRRTARCPIRFCASSCRGPCRRSLSAWRRPPTGPHAAMLPRNRLP